MGFTVKRKESVINEKYSLVNVDWSLMEKKAQKYGGSIETMMEKEYNMKADLTYPHYSIVSPGVLKFEDWVLKYKKIPHNRFFIDVKAEFQDGTILKKLVPDKDGTTWEPKVVGGKFPVNIDKTPSKTPVQQVATSKSSTADRKDQGQVVVKKTQTTSNSEPGGEKISVGKSTLVKSKNKREKSRMYRALGDFLYKELIGKNIDQDTIHVDPVLILNAGIHEY